MFLVLIFFCSKYDFIRYFNLGLRRAGLRGGMVEKIFSELLGEIDFYFCIKRIYGINVR